MIIWKYFTFLQQHTEGPVEGFWLFFFFLTNKAGKKKQKKDPPQPDVRASVKKRVYKVKAYVKMRSDSLC